MFILISYFIAKEKPKSAFIKCMFILISYFIAKEKPKSKAEILPSCKFS